MTLSDQRHPSRTVGRFVSTEHGRGKVRGKRNLCKLCS